MHTYNIYIFKMLAATTYQQMEYAGNLLATIFCLSTIGRPCYGSLPREMTPDEIYWHAVWPYTPIPNTLKDLLNSGAEYGEIKDLPMKIDETQYPQIFFYKHELYPGNTMNLVFTKPDPFAQPYGVWSYITTTKDILKQGFITYDEACVKNPPGKGQRRYCAKSLPTLVGFVVSTLGTKNLEPLSSSFLDNKTNQSYTVEGFQNLGDKAVMCHKLNFQSVVFYCHEIHNTTAYMVPMVAADGTKTNVLAVCVHDTSEMAADVRYELMKIGSASTCHYLGNKAVLWVPKNRR